MAFFVHISLFRLPPLHVLIQMDGDNLIGRKKAVLNALFQCVGDKRLAKVIQIVGTVLFIGSGGHAYLYGWLEVRISRQLLCSLALPRWHSSTIIRSK